MCSSTFPDHICIRYCRCLPPGVRLTTDTLPRPPRRLTKRLSAAFVRTAPPGFYCDGGHGLNLRVDPSGARRWVQRLVIRGHPRMLGLGGYPLVSLGRGTRGGSRQPSASTSRRGPAGRKAPPPGPAHGRGGGRRSAGAAAPRLAKRQTRARMAAQPARVCVSAYRGAVCVHGDHGRRAGNPHPHLA